MFKKFRISLMLEIIFFCLVLVLFSCFSIQYFAISSTENAIKDTMGQTALNIIRSVNNTIDVSKFDSLQNTKDMGNEYYEQFRQQLYSLKESAGLEYIYTMRKTADGKYVYVVDGYAMDNDEASSIGDEEDEISDIMKLSFEGQEGYEIDISDEWGDLVSAYVPIKNSSGETVGILGADFDASYMIKQLQNTKNNMKNTAVLIIVIGIFLSAIFSYILIRSIKKLQSKMQMVQQGDLTIKVINKRKDEIGRLSEAFQSMLDNTSSIIRSIRNNTVEIVSNVHNLNKGINQSNETMEIIAATISEISSGAAVQVENIENVSESMEKVFSEIQTITKNVDVVSKNSNIAIKDADEATKILNSSVKQINLVNNTVETTAILMKNLELKFEEILSFSNRVSSIASQTNLLSLNASIEAALAKEHGKGFSIVAGEIKKLALETSEDSKKIKEIITDLQSEIKDSCRAIENGALQARDGVDFILQVQAFLEKLSNSNIDVDNSVKEVAQAIMNIEKDSNYVLKNIIQLSDISREFSGKSQQTAAATEEQLSITEETRRALNYVKDIVEKLNTVVGKFKID